jgi:hypothetical protein
VVALVGETFGLTAFAWPLGGFGTCRARQGLIIGLIRRCRPLARSDLQGYRRHALFAGLLWLRRKG